MVLGFKELSRFIVICFFLGLIFGCCNWGGEIIIFLLVFLSLINLLKLRIIFDFLVFMVFVVGVLLMKWGGVLLKGFLFGCFILV